MNRPKTQDKGLLSEKLADLENLFGRFHNISSPGEKAVLLMQEPKVIDYLSEHPYFRELVEKSDSHAQSVLLQLVAIGQADKVIGHDSEIKDRLEDFANLVEVLRRTDKYYASLGGIIGCQLAVCRHICQKGAAPHLTVNVCRKPPVVELRHDANLYRKVVKEGIESMPHYAEIYVLGGAADRLNFRDASSGESLPAALFMFQGVSLLEGLFRDLQAREYLHYKLYGWQEETPVVMMTSSKSASLIIDYCRKKNWFGRSEGSIKVITQPLVPLISIKGEWCVEKPLSLVLRPGGHGALWKLALEEGVFDWLLKLKRRFAVIRQINNPLAGVDGTLLALAGAGWSQKKAFGFVSCDRLMGAAEGVNVLIEHKDVNGSRYALTNVEYTSLPPELTADHPEGRDYPANTNILYTDLRAIQKAIPANPLPGMVINMKTKVETDAGEVLAGRVETLMQNIADNLLSEPYPEGHKPSAEGLSSFVVLNHRKKTISVTKKEYVEGKGLIETPAGAYYDLLLNYYDLFYSLCGIKLPYAGSQEDFVQGKWGFLAYLHPSLGPLFEVAAQKIRGGSFEKGSVLELEIAELDMSNISLDGCLRVRSDAPLGINDENKVLRFSERSGKCSLRNVTIVNQGVEREGCVPWKKQMKTKEALEIVLHGDAEFYAHGVTFKGNKRYEVPAGWRLKVVQEGEELKETFQKVAAPSWWWHYAFAADGTIVLRKMAQA